MTIVINKILIHAGFVADCQVNRYGLKGSSICLSISPRNQSLTNVGWRRFKRKEELTDAKEVSPHFEKRMSLNFSDMSLTIHNLEENDSGLYEAIKKWESEPLAAFTLTVESKICISCTLHAYNMIYTSASQLRCCC